ncbi:MAG: GxxExxY protein [Gemmatimonadetes bacterium]|nr:GxxExxY protein [Gemmatimonadota bacterium]
MAREELIERELTHSIIGAFYEVYNTLGFGFLESIYSAALERELRARGHVVAREFAIRVEYKGEEVGFQRVDLIVGGAVVFEVKSTPVLAPTAQRQLFNYLRGTSLRVGLLLHFGPEPRFYRLVSMRNKTDSQDPDHPRSSDSPVEPRHLRRG